MTSRALVNPWFTDPIDKQILIQGINDLLSTMNQGVTSTREH